MKTLTGYLCLALLCWSIPAGAVTITDLFTALREQPLTKLDTIRTREAELKLQSVHDRFYPALTGVGSYEVYNSPTNLRPVLPTESARLLANGEPLPFSDNIGRVGVRFSLPIFVKELFSLGRQAQILAAGSRVQKRLNLLEHQAVLVAADAHLVHMSYLEKALRSRKASLEKTRADVIIKVKNGRIPAVEKVRMDEAINQIDLTFNQTWQQESELKKDIESLTGIFLDKPVRLTRQGHLREGELFALKPLEKNIEAGKFGVQAAKDKLYPSIIGTARWFHNYGEGYNTGAAVDDEYGSYALTLQVPLFNKPAYTAIEQEKAALLREQVRFAGTRIELQARAGNLTRTLALLGRSMTLGRKSIDHERDLLKVAEVAYAGRRMDQEEYLRYEEKVLTAEANYYLTEARWWKTFATLAVLYGNNLEELVK